MEPLQTPCWKLKSLSKNTNSEKYQTLLIHSFYWPYSRWSRSQMREGWGKKALSKICYTYPMMKLVTIISYLKKIKTNINHMTRLLSIADINISSPEISKFCYIKKYRPLKSFVIQKKSFLIQYIKCENIGFHWPVFTLNLRFCNHMRE